MNPRQHALLRLLAVAMPATCVMFAGRAAQAAEPRKLSLDEAVRLALQKQPQLAIARSQLDVSRARLTESSASYFPQLTPSMEYTAQRSAYHVGGQLSTATSERSETSVGLRQLLYDTGRREANVAAARNTMRASEQGLRNTRQTVILNVTTAYYELLRRRDLLRVQEATVERARTTFEATKAFAEVGTVRRIDILQAEADYGNARVQLGIANNDVRVAEIALRNAVGSDTSESVTASDQAPQVPSEKPEERAVSAMVADAMANRPDLLRDRAYLDADRASAKLARIAAGVQVQADFSAGYRFDPDRGDNRVFMTTVTYPLFDGGAARARVRSAEESIKQASLQLELSRQEIHLAVEEAYLSREEARLRIAAARAAEAAAKANFDAASEGYKEGAQTVVDVITARTQLVTAETGLVQALYDYHTADARLRRAVGSNDTQYAGR
jgi:TolC family type I secretion outer membrane protein